MRAVWIVVAGVVTSTAHGDPGLFQYDATTQVQPARQLAEKSCDLDVVFRGALVDVELRQQVENTSSARLAATQEVAVPEGARLIGLTMTNRAGDHAAGVPAGSRAIHFDPDLLGPDPAIAEIDEAGYHVILQPFTGTANVAMRWTTFAEIRGGALRVTLPGRPPGMSCRGHVTAHPGPGATVQRIRAHGDELARDGQFWLTDSPREVDVELAFAKPTPIAWTQTEPLGGGWTAQALTVLAPPSPAVPGRVLLVIDGSRSMQLVGRDRVAQVVRSIAATAAAGTQLEAIVYDHVAHRVFDGWRGVDAVSEIEQAIARSEDTGGSDLVAALALAGRVAADAPTSIVVITDGMQGALRPHDREAGVHVIVLDPHGMQAPDREVMVAAALHGGSFVEVHADELDDALDGLADWLGPAWLELAAGRTKIPDQVLAGGGFIATSIVHGTAPVTLHGRGVAPFTVSAVEATHASIAQLALARATDDDLAPGDATAARRLRSQLSDSHPAVDYDHALVVLSTTGRLARQRRELISAGGGNTYTRSIEIADPPSAFCNCLVPPPPPLGGSVLDRTVAHRLLVEQLQPHAYVCFQRAIGRAPALAGTATFQLDIARGEVMLATVHGLGDAAFDQCLLDAAYGLAPPLPTPGYNTDDRSIINYALTFSTRDDHPLIIAGDADSSTPIDIEHVTPLGTTLRP